jgi:methyl-accepting chemotaxis protein
MKFTIGKKLGMGFGLCIAVIIVLVTYNYFQLNRLQDLQSQGADRAKDAIVVSEAAGMGQKLYQVVADAVIGRNLKEAQRDWTDVKEESVTDLDNVAKHCVSDQEKAWAAEAQKALTALVSLFEDELMPLLQSGNPSTARIQELDDQIDAQVDAMGKPLSAILASVQKRSDEADKIYASIGQNVIFISIVLSIAGLIAAAAVAFFITRAITVPLGAMAAAARKIAEGEVNQNVEHHSSDETGDLAEAFRECIDYIKGIASAADVLSRGELSAKVVAKSERDVLSQSFLRLIGYIKEMARAADVLSEGDLKAQVAPRSEQDMLSHSFLRMKENLQKMVSEIRQASFAISSGASHISQGNSNLSQRTQEQASALEETASSIEEMTSTVKQNADNARQANQLAAGAREQAEKGGEVAAKAVSAMVEINNSSKKIADIIGVIDGIAFQTNLLALNAAVEAARAGEQGRGFAVVAAEVRKLAQRSAEAAKEISGLIKDSVEKVAGGSRLVDASGQALQEIVQSVKKVSDIVAEIAAASQEQSSGIEQINKAVSQMDEVTQQNAALVEEAASASESMDSQSQALMSMMEFFKVDGQQEQSTGNGRPSPRQGIVAKKETVAVHNGAGEKRPVAHSAANQEEWAEF